MSEINDITRSNQNVPRLSNGDVDLSKSIYELDSMRSPEQMVSERIGGYCGTAALSFAALLASSGIPKSDIRIVTAVNSDELPKICPGKAGDPKNPNYHGGASGHVFVMLRMNPNDEKSWSVINTTSDPLSSPMNAGAHRAELKAFLEGIAHGYPQDMGLLKKMDSSDIEMTQWTDFPLSPEKLETEMKFKPINIPDQISNGMSKMTIISVNTLDNYPRHTFSQRLNWIASGSIESGICRY
jgi:hypothetical protein